MRTVYLIASTLTQVTRHMIDLQAATAVIDIEPLIAYWDTDQATLDRGLAAALDELIIDTGVRTIVFATNSARLPATGPAAPHLRIAYRAHARKPFRTAPYRDLPRPGVVIGDQIPTDGLLAWRLGYAFIHYVPNLPSIPLGPRLMRGLGRPLRPLLFTHTFTRRASSARAVGASSEPSPG